MPPTTSICAIQVCGISAYSAASCTNALSAMDLDLRVKALQDTSQEDVIYLVPQLC